MQFNIDTSYRNTVIVKHRRNNVVRPISLLNVDLKLLSYTSTERLKKLLSKLINEDLTDYVKNRFIGFNLRQIQAFQISDIHPLFITQVCILLYNVSTQVTKESLNP
jgi:hypothetical protein